ncbi:hypothetical protein GIB67_007014 [Kingdonia uniflora]|uniref:Uncharacterized protein n=1 Tax=Kingdonia uniflora TaxID=39325 RepID=A0A7J7NZ86_9MAGN|nr:hypothetical protein GIB67_007014 [Kingdonia uniflora]
MPNFSSSRFEIRKSSSARENVVHHDVEVVYHNPIESDDERNIDDEGNDNVNEVDEDNINSNDEGVHLGCHFLGQMDVLCTHCSALHWKDEQLSKSLIIKPLFGQCCIQGKIKVLNLDALPNEFQELYDGNGPHSRSFRSASTDHRRYNLPSTHEIAVILPRDGSEISGVRDIIVYRKANQGLMQISECHPAYLLMHYVLLLPTGQLGWSVYLKHWNVAANA